MHKKIYGLLLLPMLLISGMAHAETTTLIAKTITAIEIEGNRYIETAAILAKLSSKVNNKLDRKKISRDVRKIFAYGFFSDVRVEGFVNEQGVRVVFIVKENPLIAEMEILGNDEIVDKDLKPKLKLKPGRVLSEASLRTDRNTIRKAYLKKGYYQVSVEAETKELSDGRIHLTLTVNEGEVTQIKRIRFVGNDAFSHDQLLDQIASRESNFASWFSDSDVFNRERFGADVQLLTQYYLEHGYMDAKVESTQLSLTPDQKNFYLTFSLYEGPQYTVDAIDVLGDLVPSKEALMELLAFKVGDFYSMTALRHSIEAITRRVGDEGYAFANVTPLFKRDVASKKVSITFDIEKGREIYIERIEIFGNAKTTDHVIRRELRQSESSRYNATDFERGKARLNRTQLFSDVRMSLPKGSAEDRANIKVDVEENKTGTFSVGLGYSDIQKVFFTGSVEEKNFLGRGYVTNLSADIGSATKNYNLSLTDPYFLDSDVRASMNVFKTQTKLEDITSYTEDSTGFGFGIGVPISEYSSYAIDYRYTDTNLTDIQNTASIFLRSQEGRNVVSEVTQVFAWDTRDKTLAPSKGHLERLNVGFAGFLGGGDYDFVEVGASSVSYFKLNESFTLSPMIGFRSINSLSDTDLPITRRYSLGGMGSLPGFDTYGVSLRDPLSDDIVGGDKEFHAALNLFFPLPYMETAGFRGVFFLNAGTVWGEVNTTVGAETISVAESFSMSKIRSSVGVGIEWVSPIGPLTLSWGYPISSQPDDKLRTFEFGLGVGF